MAIKVNPNRMELLKLKKRTVIAKRGHKLLKDKLDELMKRFLILVQRNRELRQSVEEKLLSAYQLFAFSRAESQKGVLEEALSFPHMKTEVEVTVAKALNVDIPQFSLQETGTFDCYSLSATPAGLDNALWVLSEALQELVWLAELEKTVEVLAKEIEKTRRRVNALEHILIPQLESTIKFVSAKLDEIERDARTRVMKIKEMVNEEKI